MSRDDSKRARYVQMDNAQRILDRCMDTRYPRYDCKRKVWYYHEGENRREDVYLDRLVQEFAGARMQFRYRWKEQMVTRCVFAEVLEDMVSRYEELSVEGFEEDYNRQQLEWLGIIRVKLMEVKGKLLSMGKKNEY